MFVPCFPYLTEINQAHVVMLARCGIITPDIARELATALLELARAGPEVFDLDPAREDAYFNYEAKVIEKTGANVGGRMHIGRSRNDLQAALDRMRCRDYCLDILAALNEVRHVALERAAAQTHAVMPGYTHLQPAQPVTFGYYLVGIAGAFERDFGRIAGAYSRMNLNPLGAGALAGTSFPIDRNLTGRAARIQRRSGTRAGRCRLPGLPQSSCSWAAPAWRLPGAGWPRTCLSWSRTNSGP